MASIDNDQHLRTALKELTADQQRVLGCKFADHVNHLSKDDRVIRAIATGLQATLSAGELEDAFKVAKAYSVKTYTDCGKDTDWLAQADHFVAAAAASALTPNELMAEKQNRAWRAAVHARMAVNCSMMEDDSASESDEARHQYALTTEYLDAL